MSDRLSQCFARAAKENRAALITYVMASDPDEKTTAHVLETLAASGADIIELGMPFSDPMADGPVIQEAAIRSLKAGGSLANTLKLAQNFRAKQQDVALILMGYFNPILHYGLENFARDAEKAGVDGVIIVDLPPEEEDEFLTHTHNTNLDFIRLTSPTTSEARAEVVLRRASGFVYYISVRGITGGASGRNEEIKKQVQLLKRKSNLPVAVGFGIKTPQQAHDMAQLADGVVVGSAIVNKIKEHVDDADKAVQEIAAYVKELRGAMVRYSHFI